MRKLTPALFRSSFPAWLLGAMVATAGAQSPDLLLQLSSEVAGPNAEVSLSLTLDNLYGDIQGWSWGVCHPAGAVTIEDVVMGEVITTINNGNQPDFHVVDYYPDGWVVGAVISAYGCCVLPPGVNYEMYDVIYQAGPNPALVDLLFCNTLSNPPIITGIVIGGESIPPTTVGGSIEILPEAPFHRGDGNQDGNIDIADVIYTELYLFLGGETPGCLDACDTNDDGALNVADPIYLLSWLFVGGPPPSSPSGACGSDPTEDGIGCEEFGYEACP